MVTISMSRMYDEEGCARKNIWHSVNFIELTSTICIIKYKIYYIIIIPLSFSLYKQEEMNNYYISEMKLRSIHSTLSYKLFTARCVKPDKTEGSYITLHSTQHQHRWHHSQAYFQLFLSNILNPRIDKVRKGFYVLQMFQFTYNQILVTSYPYL